MKSLSNSMIRSGRRLIFSSNLLFQRPETSIKHLNPTAIHLQTTIRQIQTVKIRFFEESSNSLVEVDAPIGKRVLDIALENNIDIEGACGGELACSTCHVVVSPELYAQLPPKKEEEQDMLDLAWGITDTSRLCCQIIVTPELANAEFRVPAETNNMFQK